MSAPSVAHESRAEKLRTIAGLKGCTITHAQLADGSRPDLVASDPFSSRWMIGDAKHSEDPGCVDTAVRLYGYLRWVAAAHARGIEAVFLLCCPTRMAGRWALRIRFLLDEAGMSTWTTTASDIGDDDVIIASYPLGLTIAGPVVNCLSFTR